MNFAVHFLAAHWLAIAVLVFALILSVRRLLLRRAGLPLVITAFALPAIGALLLPSSWAWWVGIASASVLFILVVILLLSGAWWAPLAWIVAVTLLLAVGGLWINPAGDALAEAARALLTVEFVHPGWLALLALLPVIVLVAGRSLDWRSLRRGRVESWRPWLSVLLRCAIVALLALALAEPRLRQPNERMTVLFVLDRSQSIPEEFGPAPGTGTGIIDLRWDRLRRFINDSVQQRGAGHERDRAGLIVFGRKPRLELPPSDAPRFNLTDIASRIDGSYTDISAALKLALASFPEGTGKRIVLISDGNENLGNAQEQARLARSLGVQIDVVPVAAGRRNEDEVLVERIDVPPLVEQGGQVPVRVLVRSYNPNIVVGKLTLKQTTEDQTAIIGTLSSVQLHLGLNSFAFTRPLTDQQRSYTYEAEFEPQRIVDAAGNVLYEGRPPGDRPQNNRASAHVMARGQRRVLILQQGPASDHSKLAATLTAAGRAKFLVDLLPISVLERYPDRDRLARFLGDYDCVILANVPADQVNNEQMEALRSNTHDQGCGLIMIGGPEGFGAGGWQDTPVERALPVNCDIRSLKVQGKGGLVLIMHACEMADGNFWEKKIAKLAIDKLGPADEVGVLQFTGQTVWHIPMTPVGGNKTRLKALVDTLTPGDMPDFDPGLIMAHKELMDPARGLSKKHIIIISDGDPMQNNRGILTQMARDLVTVTTVGVATHGAPQDQALKAIAVRPGQYYKVTNASQLPAIYTHETRLVSLSFVHKKPPIRPVVVFRSGPTDKLPDRLAELGGFVRTTVKNSPLVEVPLITPQLAEQEYPLLAYWHYGLGKSVAFTSDAGNPEFWSRVWAEQEGGVYAKFWEQVVDWSLRPTESKRLNMMTEYRDGKVKVTVEAHTDDGRPDTKLRLRAGVTGPGEDPEGAKKQALVFVQKNSGQYELEVKAEEAGSYFVTAQATRTVKQIGKDGKEHEVEEAIDSVRSGVSLPYSPEFAETESNTSLLERIREVTEGQHYDDNDASLTEAARSGEVFRRGPDRVKSLLPLWHWLLFAAGMLLFFDVAVRRIALEPARVQTVAERIWARLRGRTVAPQREEFFERLRSRKVAVGEGLTRPAATRRFEAGEGATPAAPAGADAPIGAAPPSSTQPTSPPPSTAPQPDAPAEDLMARLQRAKKKAMDERKKEGP
jgi:uncharacterized membrane protein